jgi:hypothetical protein
LFVCFFVCFGLPATVNSLIDGTPIAGGSNCRIAKAQIAKAQIAKAQIAKAQIVRAQIGALIVKDDEA